MTLFVLVVWYDTNVSFIRRWDVDEDNPQTTTSAKLTAPVRKPFIDDDDSFYQKSENSPEQPKESAELSDEDELDKYMAGIEVSRMCRIGL